MAKLTLEMGDTIRPERHRSKFPGLIVLMILIVGIAPFALEGITICMANWKAFMGVSAHVQTPMIDALSDTVQSSRDELSSIIAPWFHQVPWDPKIVLLTSAVVMASAMLMLKR